MINPEHIEPSEQAEPKQAEPLTLDRETLKDLDPSPQDAVTVKGGRAKVPDTDSCKLDGCSYPLYCNP